MACCPGESLPVSCPCPPVSCLSRHVCLTRLFASAGREEAAQHPCIWAHSRCPVHAYRMDYWAEHWQGPQWAGGQSLGTASVGCSAHPPGSESLTAGSENRRKKVRAREKRHSLNPAPAPLTLPPKPQHILRPHGTPPQAVTHAPLARPRQAASSDTHFPLLGGAEQGTGENHRRGFLPRLLPPSPSPPTPPPQLPPRVAPVPAESLGPQPLTSMAQGASGARIRRHYGEVNVPWCLRSGARWEVRLPPLLHESCVTRSKPLPLSEPLSPSVRSSSD